MLESKCQRLHQNGKPKIGNRNINHSFGSLLFGNRNSREVWERVHGKPFHSEKFEACKVTIASLYIITGAFIDLAIGESREVRLTRGITKSTKWVSAIQEFMRPLISTVEKEIEAQSV